MNRPAIRSILVVGDGIVGLSAALAFRRALPGVEVRVLKMPPDPATIADHFPSMLPTVGRFHAAIGLDELDLVRRNVAVHHLGTRFTGTGGGWCHSFGDVGRGEGAVPFHQIWLAARRSGAALPFGAYSTASAIGSEGKFVHPSGDPRSPLATYLYGLRVNPRRYRETLLAAASDVPQMDGELGSVERNGDNIAALCLADGTTLEADLYVDCSGPAGRLISELSDEFDDWSAWLPARHISTAWESGKSVEPLARIEPITDGWRLTSSTPESSMSASVTTSARPGSTAIAPGRRRNTFVGNVLAIGDAAVALDPLHGANLSLAHSAILRAIALIPGRDMHSLELAEYNRLTALEADRARDFHALFQLLLATAEARPASLERTLTQWQSRGRLPFFEEEVFTESDWLQALIGLGFVPDAVAPSAEAIDTAAAAPAMADLAAQIAQIAERLPPYPDYLAHIQAAPSGGRPR